MSRFALERSEFGGATHLFEGPGTLAEVARLAAKWLTRDLYKMFLQNTSPLWGGDECNTL